ELEIVDAGGADGSDSEEDMEPPKKLQSRSQMRARASFRHIDNGKEDAQAVFALIGAPRLRVDTKLDFFRERAEMVLPPIEEGFMVHNRRLNCNMVDVRLLHRIKAFNATSSGSFSAREHRSSRKSLPSDSSCSPDNSHSQLESYDPNLSHDLSCGTLPEQFSALS
ncbi:unnamed protein product, partial [Polarella glacialis]